MPPQAEAVRRAPGWRAWVLTGAALIIWLLLSAANYFAWTRGADHRDFFPRWAGARYLLLQGGDLYSEAATRHIQVTLYGGPLPPEADQQAFAYPAHIVPLLLPFWLIPDRYVATALWQGLSVLMLLAALRLAAPALTLRQGWPLLLMAGWVYPALMIFNGQFSILAVFSVAWALWAYTQGKDVTAGLALLIGTIKPELVLLPCLFLLGTALMARRWRLLLSFGLGGLALLGVSVALAGWWVSAWLLSVQRYAGYAASSWAPATAWNLHPLLLMIMLTAAGGCLWLLRRSPQALLLAAAPLGMLLVPQTIVWGLSLMLVPLAAAWNLRTRWAIGGLWLAGWIGVLLADPASNWWRWHNLLVPLISLGILAWASANKKAA